MAGEAREPDAEGFVRTRWWWVRHAPVTGNGGRIYGRSDPPCDCGDVARFRRLARILPQGAVWVASDLQRTRQTAAAIWAAGYGDGVALETFADFAEQDFGAWQGVERAVFLASHRSIPGSYWFFPADHKAPGGESFADLVARVAPRVGELNGRFRGRDIVAVGHGGSIRAALAVAFGIGPQEVLGVAIDNCSVTRLDYIEAAGESGWRVIMVNHLPWLDGGAAEEGAVA